VSYSLWTTSYASLEKVAVSSQEVVKRDTIKIYDIQRPESLDLGLRHAEQISLLANALLAEQTID